MQENGVFTTLGSWRGRETELENVKFEYLALFSTRAFWGIQLYSRRRFFVIILQDCRTVAEPKIAQRSNFYLKTDTLCFNLSLMELTR